MGGPAATAHHEEKKARFSEVQQVSQNAPQSAPLVTFTEHLVAQAYSAAPHYREGLSSKAESFDSIAPPRRNKVSVHVPKNKCFAWMPKQGISGRINLIFLSFHLQCEIYYTHDSEKGFISVYNPHPYKKKLRAIDRFTGLLIFEDVNYLAVYNVP